MTLSTADGPPFSDGAANHNARAGNYAWNAWPTSLIAGNALINARFQ